VLTVPLTIETSARSFLTTVTPYSGGRHAAAAPTRADTFSRELPASTEPAPGDWRETT